MFIIIIIIIIIIIVIIFPSASTELCANASMLTH